MHGLINFVLICKVIFEPVVKMVDILKINMYLPCSIEGVSFQWRNELSMLYLTVVQIAP